MKASLKLAALLVAALAIAACNAGGSSSVPVSGGGSQAAPFAFKHVPVWAAKHQARTTCPQVVGRPTCLALQVEKGGIVPLCSPSSGCGFTPAQLETRYGLTKKLGNGSGTKVAVIEAGDFASATSDLGTYRSQYGLGTGILTRYNENGQTSGYPPSCQNYGWCLETALDIDMVSASCPKCTIYLMEAKGGISDFEKAEASAVTLGATILSNSWICYGSWDCQDTNFPNYFNTAGITYIASSGDAGYDSIGGPSVLDTVIAAGGTQLALSGSTYSESAWIDAGAGCANTANVGSPGVPKPTWQADPKCSNRTDADISAESGCSPGVAVYISLYGGWTGVCGTSVASPFLAGVTALAGNEASLNAGQYVWSFTSPQRSARLHAITTGNDGSCGNTYLCTAGTHQYKSYSGPTGWGTPKTIKSM